MNTKEVRFYLHNYHANKEIITRLKSDLIEYRLMDGIGCSIISEMPTSRSGTNSKVEQVLTREYRYKGESYELIEYIRKLEDELHYLMKIDLVITKVYASLQEPIRTIIEMRYFLLGNQNDVRQFKHCWVEIAEEIDYSEKYCKELDGIFILQLQEQLLQI